MSAQDRPGLKRYGKPAAGVLGVRQGFFADNAGYLRESERHAALYRAQPARTACKLCEAALPVVADFHKQGIPYVTCTGCGHLNGQHQDTDGFAQALYLDPAYASYYASADHAAYEGRVQAIYTPKVEFLAEALAERGQDVRELAHADLGAGSGYYARALELAGCARVQALEASPAQVAFANGMLGRDAVRLLALPETVPAMGQLRADVVSMIGVLEHLQQPREVLAALRANRSVRYLFLVLPLFGLCVYLEMAFPWMYPRHLVSDHTHLFTPRSIAVMEQEFALTRRAEWWFGSDMLDFYRGVALAIDGQPAARGMADAWRGAMQQCLDAMQLGVDRQHLCSEVHLLLEFER